MNCKLQPHADDSDPAYGMQVIPIQDYQLVQVEVYKPIWAVGSDVKSLFPWARIRQRREQLQREKVILDFQRQLAGLLDERDDNFLVCMGRASQGSDARRLVPLPLFDKYLERQWAQRLLPYGICHHFIILGTAPYLPQMLGRMAPRMKSLLWILPDHSHARMLEDFTEDFYQEYGLAINLRYLPINESYGQFRMEGDLGKEPLNVWDFTGDRHVPNIIPAPGSIWLDMASMEEKEKRVAVRMPGVTYLSLKKQWRQPQKAPYLLDTVSKNRYNT